ncbi:hypothetical protein [Photobacterium damselae]
MSKSQGYDDCQDLLERILPHIYARDIQTGLRTRFDGLEKPRRAIRTLNEFLLFVADHGVSVTSSDDLSLFFHAYQEMYITEHLDKKAHITIFDDLGSLAFTIESLQSLGVFPPGHIAPVRKLKDSSLFQDSANDSNKVLGGLELPKQSEDNKIPLTLRLNAPAEEFLCSLVSNIRRHRNTVLHISRAYLQEASSRLDFKDAAIKLVPESLFDNPSNLSSELNIKGQRYSLFNKERFGESAKSNLVAYLYYKHNGLVTDDFNGRTHLNSFGGTGELREYFGLSSLSAVAAQNIIVIESGINVDSLRGLEVGSKGCLKDSFRLTDDGFNIIYDKPRASSPRNKNLGFVDDSEINITYAFEYLVRSTEHYRTLVSPEDSSFLFIHDTMKAEGRVCRISSLPFKLGFTRLLIKAKCKLSQDPNWCKGVTEKDIDELLKHAPTAKQLRVSEGILRWYDSGGDPFVASNYLGNSESVALKNYIPKELQGVLYSHQISKFQHLLLAAATDKKSYQKEVLKLNLGDGSNDCYELYIAQLDSINPNWRQLAETNAVKSRSDNNDAFALVMNKENITRLYMAFEENNKALRNGSTPDENTLILSDVFKNLVSYVNAYGQRRYRNLLRDTINSVRKL